MAYFSAGAARKSAVIALLLLKGAPHPESCAFNFRRYLSFVRPFFRLSDDRL